MHTTFLQCARKRKQLLFCLDELKAAKVSSDWKPEDLEAVSFCLVVYLTQNLAGERIDFASSWSIKSPSLSTVCQIQHISSDYCQIESKKKYCSKPTVLMTMGNPRAQISDYTFGNILEWTIQHLSTQGRVCLSLAQHITHFPRKESSMHGVLNEVYLQKPFHGWV